MATSKKAQEAPEEAQEGASPPEGATVTPEDFEARKAAYEAEQEEEAASAGPDLTTCVNDGKPAAYRTTGSGRVPVAFCEACAKAVYPDGAGLEAIDAPSE